ncbi:predicted protein [Chaetoceros tenuissimus]|uniref:USP domain-containing protein n=1 Tax=Chaetoceros tenuissimus TaxID=426638 RepID=A0AAD3CNZ9_9STRA|nr:predicted protein [Chaetoceros tenuissimus]
MKTSAENSLIPYRKSIGIRNVYGESCHVAAALQVIFHSLSDKCLSNILSLNTIINTSDRRYQSLTFLREFSILLSQMTNESGEDGDTDDALHKNGIDPTAFYETLENVVECKNVGDAGSSTRSILSKLYESLETLEKEIPNSKLISESIISELNFLFRGGSICHELRRSRLEKVQDKSSQNSSGCKIIKRKHSRAKKLKTLASPLPIPVRGYKSVSVALRSTLFSTQYIDGYKWENVDFDEEIIDMSEERSDNIIELMDGINLCDDRENSDNCSACDDDSSSSSDSSESSDSSSASSDSSDSSSSSSQQSHDSFNWKTKRISYPLSLPNIVLLQLNRSEFCNGLKRLVEDAIDIPMTLEIDSNYYHLIGAVQHTDRPIDDIIDDNIGFGHYVTYMKRKQPSESYKIESNDWVKFDDHRVNSFQIQSAQTSRESGIKSITEKQFCALLGGKTKKKRNFATMLLYKSHSATT